MAATLTQVFRGAAICVLALGLAACGPTFRNHGYVPDPEDLAAVTVGVDTRESVESTIGLPTTTGVQRETAWYYVRDRVRRFGPQAPRTIDRELVAVSFAADGTVANVERFGLEQGRVVALSRRVTETSIQDFGLVQQILRNFGRIDIGEALAGDDG
jgi:outer membrane protein assembly factor BamE (lipoprotein component of BamABCDE complex)